MDNPFFKSNWRPFIGWVCGSSLAYHFIVQPFIILLATIFGYTVPILPEFDMNSLMIILGSLLGLGSLRTFEKYKGVEANSN